MTQPAGDEILLDATAMEPPEPLQQATSILHQLETGQYLRMLHRHLPHPLFASCQQLDISYRHFTDSDNKPVILFWRSDDSGMAEFCEQISE